MGDLVQLRRVAHARADIVALRPPARLVVSERSRRAQGRYELHKRRSSQRVLTCSTRFRTTWEPMKPAQPVTATGPSAAVMGAIISIYYSGLNLCCQCKTQYYGSAIVVVGERHSSSWAPQAFCSAGIERGLRHVPVTQWCRWQPARAAAATV